MVGGSTKHRRWSSVVCIDRDEGTCMSVRRRAIEDALIQCLFDPARLKITTPPSQNSQCTNIPDPQTQTQTLFPQPTPNPASPTDTSGCTKPIAFGRRANREIPDTEHSVKLPITCISDARLPRKKLSAQIMSNTKLADTSGLSRLRLLKDQIM